MHIPTPEAGAYDQETCGSVARLRPCSVAQGSAARKFSQANSPFLDLPERATVLTVGVLAVVFTAARLLGFHLDFCTGDVADEVRHPSRRPRHQPRAPAPGLPERPACVPHAGGGAARRDPRPVRRDPGAGLPPDCPR